MTSVLPPNVTLLERNLENAVKLPALPVPVKTLWSPDDCPVAFLPWFAWSLGIDTWLPEWPEAVKREKIRTAIHEKRIRGTRASVQQAIEGLGAAAYIREWWEVDPPGDPCTFGVVIALDEVEGAPPSADYINSIIAAITHAKREAAHFDFTQQISAAGAIGMTGAARPAIFARLAMTE